MYYIAIGWFVFAFAAIGGALLLDGELLRSKWPTISDRVQDGDTLLGIFLIAWTVTLPIALTVHLVFSKP